MKTPNDKSNNTNSQRNSAEQESIESLFSKAVRHHRYGELSKAEVLYQAILIREPNHALVMKKYGVLSFQLSDYLLAEQMFEEAYSLTPFDEQLSVNLVLCKMKLDKPEEALPVLEAILLNNPDSIVAKELNSQINTPVNEPDLETVSESED